MLFKPGVDWNVHQRVKDCAARIEKAWLRYGLELVVTSGRDGQHKRGSLHYVGLAFDVRRWNIPPQLLELILREARDLAGLEWQIIDEPTHLHVEYDPR